MKVSPKMTMAETLVAEWQDRIQTDCSSHPSATQMAIVNWLVGEDHDRYNHLSPEALEVARQAMDYRYRILRDRYLNVGPEAAYQSLIRRLGSLFLVRQKIRTWVALSRDRQRTVMDVVQEVIQELLQSDRHLQRQMRWIADCTPNARLRNALLLASLEEYCLRPVRNQPLLVYRFVNYLRRTQRGGLTQVPVGDLIRLVSEEVTPDDPENPISLFDSQALSDYQNNQSWEERQVLRMKVQREFEEYLAREVDPLAARWLRLYLQGCTQESISDMLQMPIKQVYRLREKVSYHALRVFALKAEPELVGHWLEISLKEHNLGLTPSQWQDYYNSLTPTQQALLDKLKAGQTLEEIAREWNWKASQISGEWSKLYLAAQSLRNN